MRNHKEFANEHQYNKDDVYDGSWLNKYFADFFRRKIDLFTMREGYYCHTTDEDESNSSQIILRNELLAENLDRKNQVDDYSCRGVA